MLVLSATQIVLCVISGGIVGFSLGLIGGGAVLSLQYHYCYMW